MDFVALDVETANPDLASVCQIGIARFEDGTVIEEFSTLVNPQDYFDPMNMAVHGIRENDVQHAPVFNEVSDRLNKLLGGAICATHTPFDRSAIHQACSKHGVMVPSCSWLDTARVARRTWEAVQHKGYGLANLASMLGIDFRHHDALEDAKAAGMILCAAIKESGIALDEWTIKVKQPISGRYPPAIKIDGNPDGPLFGEVVTFTGEISLPRPHAAAMAAELGCEVKPNVSKKTTMLVVGDQDLRRLAGRLLSSKHRRALELIQDGCAIRIVRESDFLALLEAQ